MSIDMLIADKLIKKTRYVSFDVFDTLIKRSVAKPSDLFLLMENHLVNTKSEIYRGFAEKRIAAEREGNSELDRPIGLSEIYERLRGEYGKDTDELSALEIKTEMDGCRPNPELVDLFNKCIESGKTVIIISDMYLPESVIAEMLNKCGVHGYDKLYVSCERGSRKRDGKLFRIVLEDMNIRPRELVHIGDSRRADFAVPVMMGIKSIWIKNGQKKLCKIPKDIKSEDALAYRTMQACIRNCSRGMSEYESMGCRVFGPQLYGFVNWLKSELTLDDIDEVYFMSRDGYMMQKAFDIVKNDDMKTHYLYCSRRAYQVSMMWKHSSFEGVTRSFSHIARMTLRLFLEKVGLNPEDFSQRLSQIGLDLDEIYYNFTFYRDKKIIDFYDKEIRSKVVENSKNEYKALTVYLSSLNFGSKIAVVDIGYYGTMQKALTEIVQNEKYKTTILGYYVCLAPDASNIKNGLITAKGYLNGSELASYTPAIAEGQYLAPHGSVKKFQVCNGGASPIFYQFEYKNDNGQKIDELSFITLYQSGAVKYVRYLHDAHENFDSFFSPEVSMYEAKKLINSPSLSEAKVWGNIRESNYGEIKYIACPRSLWFYLFHPKTFLRDFIASGWKVGFLKRLFLIPFPYKSVCSILRKKYKKTASTF